MSDDPVIRLAMQRVVAASADIEAQLALPGVEGTRPVLMVLIKARNEAAYALARLAQYPTVDESNLAEMRQLQNDVKRYADILDWFRQIVADGFSYDQQLTEEDKQEMLDILTSTPEGQEEAAELGLVARVPAAEA